MKMISRDDNTLKHFGILGMKWGVRRYQDASGNYTSDGKKRYLKDKTSGIQKDIDSFKGHEKGIYDKKGKMLLSPKDVSNSVSSLKNLKQKREAKLSRKWDITKTADKLEKDTTRAERFLFNEATRKRAAKFIVDNNVSVAEAKTKANKEAIRNTAIFLGVYGAVKLAEYKMK